METQETQVENHKNDEFIHFLKINIFGDSGVGKTSLISYFENFDNDDFTIKNDNINNDIEIESISSDNLNLSLVQQIKRIAIDFNEDRNLYFNIYETSLIRYDSIKINLDNLLFQSECIIIMWDNNNLETFDNIPNFVSTIISGMKQNKFKNVPIFIIQNKTDLNLDNNEIEEINNSIENLKQKYPEIIYKKISLLNKEDFMDLFRDMFLKMEILEKDTNKNKYKYDILYTVKMKHPFKMIDNNPNNINNKMNILFLGDIKVGKTTFFNNLINNKIEQQNINHNFVAEINDNKINIEINEEKIISNISNYKNVDGILLFFDLTNKNTFEGINDWINCIVNNYGEINNSYELFLIGNKVDETEKRNISKKDANNYSDKYNIRYYECSCLKGLNIYEILNEIILMSYDKYYNKNINEENNNYNSEEENNKVIIKDKKKEEETEEEKEKEEEKEEEIEKNEEKEEKHKKNKNISKIILDNNNISSSLNRNEIKNKNNLFNEKENSDKIYKKININKTKFFMIELIMIILYMILYSVIICYFI